MSHYGCQCARLDPRRYFYGPFTSLHPPRHRASISFHSQCIRCMTRTRKNAQLSLLLETLIVVILARKPILQKSQTLTPPLMNRLLDLIDNHALKQHVAEPTRPASMKTLDLVLTSVPTLVSNVRDQPGMSDHDLVNFCINVNPCSVCKHICSTAWTCPV